MGAVPTTVLTIPCFNERHRLDLAQVAVLLNSVDVRLVLVDDGSTDGTRELLDAAAAVHPGRIEVLAQPENRGKAEAVRAGLAHGLAAGADAVGYIDADFSTPPEEMLRLVALLDERKVSVVLGSRVRLLGRDIARRPVRHYLGRVFATVASGALGLAVYDTQCGAKVLRRSPALEAALERPFTSRWAFDVELIARLLRPEGGAAGLVEADFLEAPLSAWRDVKGSKLTPTHMVRAGGDLLRIALARRLGRG